MMSVSPQGTTLSRVEIEEAINALSTAGWVRLRKVAERYSYRQSLSAEDLLQEAFTRAIDGSRNCPRNVDVVRFLAETMRSVASDALKALSRQPELHSMSSVSEDEPEFDAPDESLNAEQVMIDDQEASRIREGILSLFEDDAVAQVIIEGDMEGMKGEEIRELAELNLTAFASKRRYIRRVIEKAYPNGWQS